MPVLVIVALILVVLVVVVFLPSGCRTVAAEYGLLVAMRVATRFTRPAIGG